MKITNVEDSLRSGQVILSEVVVQPSARTAEIWDSTGYSHTQRSRQYIGNQSCSEINVKHLNFNLSQLTPFYQEFKYQIQRSYM